VGRTFASSPRWLIFVPVAILALFSTVSSAEADVLGNWTYSQSAACGGSVEVVDNVITLHGPDQNGCSGAAHWVKIETTIPADVNTVDFSWSYQTNDGWVYDPPQYGINGVYTLITQQNNASGTKSVSVNEGDVFAFRQYSIDTCCAPGHLSIGNLSIWEFTTTSTASTTTSTTTVPTETVPVTDPVTTTLQETTTSSVPTSTSLAPEPTMLEQSTTSTTTTTLTVPETTTTTEYVSPPVAQPPAVVESEPIEEPTTEDTEPIQEPEELVEETIPLEPPDTDPTVETEDTLPFVEELPDDTTPTEVLPDEVTEEIPVEELNDEELLTAIESIEEGMEVSEELAVAVAQSAEVVASLSSEEATAVFAAIEVDNLSTEEAQAIVEAVQDAPAEVREAFEEEINIFSPGFDNYVPLGSNIPVSTRRTLIAVAAGAAIAAAGTRRQ
jgi:hypothetical protein